MCKHMWWRRWWYDACEHAALRVCRHPPLKLTISSFIWIVHSWGWSHSKDEALKIRMNAFQVSAMYRLRVGTVWRTLKIDQKAQKLQTNLAAAADKNPCNSPIPPRCRGKQSRDIAHPYLNFTFTSHYSISLQPSLTRGLRSLYKSFTVQSPPSLCIHAQNSPFNTASVHSKFIIATIQYFLNLLCTLLTYV